MRASNTQDHNAYSKQNLIIWVNSAFQQSGRFPDFKDIFRLEDFCDGIALCRLFSIFCPNSKIPLSKLNQEAQEERYRCANLKILADAMFKANILHNFDIQRVAKGNFQETLQLVQFFRKRFDGIKIYPPQDLIKHKKQRSKSASFVTPVHHLKAEEDGLDSRFSFAHNPEEQQKKESHKKLPTEKEEYNKEELKNCFNSPHVSSKVLSSQKEEGYKSVEPKEVEFNDILLISTHVSSKVVSSKKEEAYKSFGPKGVGFNETELISTAKKSSQKMAVSVPQDAKPAEEPAKQTPQPEQQSVPTETIVVEEVIPAQRAHHYELVCLATPARSGRPKSLPSMSQTTFRLSDFDSKSKPVQSTWKDLQEY